MEKGASDRSFRGGDRGVTLGGRSFVFRKDPMIVSFLTGLVVAACLSVQAPPATHEVAAVQVVGARRYAPGDVAKLSGLQIGQAVAPADIESVAERLGATGLFKSVTYRYVTTGRQMTVIFEIEETDWTDR